MKYSAVSLKKCTKTSSHFIVVIALSVLGSSAQAQISRGFIAPHEYALPVGFAPFNAFVEYATLQQTKEVLNSNGDKIGGSNTDTLVSLSKYVHFWTPAANPDIGLAWEVIVPKVGVRDKIGHTSTGGIGDPLTGFAVWYKPRDNMTLGMDMLVQIPTGDKDVGGGDRWNVVSAIIFDAQFDKINYTGNLGVNLPGVPAQGLRPGKLWHMNNRLGYRATELIEPYIGIDYERQEARSGLPKNYETAAALGIMFHTYKNSSIAAHYQKGITGQSRPLSNNLNMRFVYSW
jgi:hypothetical protein